MRPEASRPRQWRYSRADYVALAAFVVTVCLLFVAQNGGNSNALVSGNGGKRSAESSIRRLLAPSQQPAIQREAAEVQSQFCRGLASLDFPAPQIEVAWAAPKTTAGPASESRTSDADGAPEMASTAAAAVRRLLQGHPRASLQQQQQEQAGDASVPPTAAQDQLAPGRRQLAETEQQQQGEWVSGSELAQWASSLPAGSAASLDDELFSGKNGWRVTVQKAPQMQDLWEQRRRKDRTRISLKEGIKADLSFGSAQPFSMYHFSENDIVSGFIQTKASWEGGESALMAEKLERLARRAGLPRDAMYFMDVGANIGAHSLVMAAAGFSVIAFEPMRVNEQTLRHSLCANPGLASRFTLLPRGLGNATLSCAIYSVESNQGDGTVNCDPHARMAEGFQKRQDLDIVTLDGYLADWMPALRGRVGVVKIDVEGNELSVMQGGKHFFKTVRPRYVMAECSDPMMRVATGTLARDLFRQMHALGYSVHRGTFDGEQVPPSAFADFEEPGIVNYWFVLRET